MRRETFDGMYGDKPCSFCGHSYLSHYGEEVYDSVSGEWLKRPCQCRDHRDGKRCSCERFSPTDGSPAPHSKDRSYLVDRILEERRRQDSEYGIGIHHPPGRWLSAVMEEAGEIARALHDDDLNNLPIEIEQLAALCLAWLEDIERYGEERLERERREH